MDELTDQEVEELIEGIRCEDCFQQFKGLRFLNTEATVKKMLEIGEKGIVTYFCCNKECCSYLISYMRRDKNSHEKVFWKIFKNALIIEYDKEDSYKKKEFYNINNVSKWKLTYFVIKSILTGRIFLNIYKLIRYKYFDGEKFP